MAHNNGNYIIIIYGLSHKMIGEARYLRHGGNTRQNYEVPLVVLSDKINSTSLSKHRSAPLALSICLPARQGLTLPIRNSLLPQRRPEDKRRRVYNAHEMVNFEQLADDPPALL